MNNSNLNSEQDSGAKSMTQPASQKDYDARAFETLSEVAFLADTMGLHSDSENIFAALQGMKKSSPYPILGRAFTLIRMGNFSEASALLKNSSLPLDRNNNDVKSFLALCLHLEGKMKERDEVIKSIKNPSSEVANLIKNLTGYQA